MAEPFTFDYTSGFTSLTITRTPWSYVFQVAGSSVNLSLGLDVFDCCGQAPLDPPGANLSLPQSVYRASPAISQGTWDVAPTASPLTDSVDVQVAVPEPSTWALTILGLGGVGAMIRRRRSLPA